MQLFGTVRKLTGWLTFTVLIGVWPAGCGSAPPVSQPPDSFEFSLFEHMSAEEQSQAIIYLYRPSASYAALATPWVTLNGYKTVLLGNNQYTRLVVRPGYHMVQTEQSDNWISGQPDIFHFSVEKGKIHFLKISMQTEWYLGNWFEDFFMGFLCPSCEEYHMAKDTFKIEMVDKPIAIPELKKTNFILPL